MKTTSARLPCDLGPATALTESPMRLPLLLLLVTAQALAAPPYRGKKVTLDFPQAPLTEVVATLQEISKRNLLVVGQADRRVDFRVKDMPWDEAVELLVRQTGLAMRDEGAVTLLGSAELLAKRHPKARYTGLRSWVWLSGAEPAAAAQCLSLSAATPLALRGGAKLTLLLRNVPVDQLVELLAFASGAEVAEAGAAGPRPAGCVAAELPASALRLAGVASGTATPAALLEDDTGRAFTVLGKDCVGSEGLQVKAITRDAVVTQLDGTWSLGAALDPELERIPIAQGLAQLPSVTDGLERLLLELARDVLHLETFLRRRDRSPSLPYALMERVEQGLAAGPPTRPEQLAPFVAQLAKLKKLKHLVPGVEAWLLNESGDRAGMMRVLGAWMTMLEEGPFPGRSIATARRMLGYARAHGAEEKAIEGLSQRLEAVARREP